MEWQKFPISYDKKYQISTIQYTKSQCFVLRGQSQYIEIYKFDTTDIARSSLRRFLHRQHVLD